jgi:hypothetical protein
LRVGAGLLGKALFEGTLILKHASIALRSSSQLLYWPPMHRLVCSGAVLIASIAPTSWAQTVTVSFPAIVSSKPLDGRLLFLLSNDPADEPRMQIDDTPRSQMVFGVTVEGLRPGEPVTIDKSAAGYPIRSIEDVPQGDYMAQAVLNIYETFHRADGKTIKLAPDRGEGQHWNLAPGNLYSTPQKVHVGPGSPPISISLDKVIGPISP